MKDELQNYIKLSKKYDNIDGMGEMCMGLMLLGFALLGYLKASLPEHSVWRSGIPGLLFLYAVLIPVLGLAQKANQIVKRRITWPRTGYVAYHRDRKAVGPIIAIVVVGSVVTSVFTYFAYIMVSSHFNATSVGRVGYLTFLMAIYAFWIFHMGGKHSWKWLMLLVMALGLLVLAICFPDGFTKLSQPVDLFVGLLWFISGAATLFSYLRHTQSPIKEAE